MPETCKQCFIWMVCDGVVVPMDNEGCADGIAKLLDDPKKMQSLSEACRRRDYSNQKEVEKLYELLN